MARKPAMTNKRAIEILAENGQILWQDIKYKTDNFSTLFRGNNYPIWGNYRYLSYLNYMIPLDIWKKYVNPKFRPAFNIGDMVRIREKTTRVYKRNKSKQAIGDSQDFGHLGIGSGKKYLSEKQQDLRNINMPWHTRGIGNEKLLIGNLYPANMSNAIRKVKYFKENAIEKPKNKYGYWRTGWQITDFLDFIKLKGDGIFGPKRLINGYITEVYIHFLLGKWTTKRECRYKVLLETGAGGIFTNDYLKRVYNTDIELDEKLMDGCKCMDCHVRSMCDHKDVHIYDPKECDIPCNVSDHKCQAIYDYTDFFDTTHGTALELNNEE